MLPLKRLIVLILCVCLVLCTVATAADAKCLIGSEAFVTADAARAAFMTNSTLSVETQNGEQIVRAGNIIMSNATYSGNFSIVVDALVPSDNQAAEISILTGAGFTDFTQVYLHKAADGNAYVGLASFSSGGWDITPPVTLGVPFEHDRYYTVTAKYSGTKVEVLVDGEHITTFENNRTFGGRVGMRMSDERPFKNFAVFGGVDGIPASGKGATAATDTQKEVPQGAADSANIYADAFESDETFRKAFDTNGALKTENINGEATFMHEGVFLSKALYGGDYTVSVDGYVVPGSAGQEFSILIGSDAFDDFHQIYFRDGSGDGYFSYSAFNGAWSGGQSHITSQAFEVGRWYNITVKVSGSIAEAYVDGEYAATFTSLSGRSFSGKVGLRADSSTRYKNFTVYNSTDYPLEFGGELAWLSAPKSLTPLTEAEFVIKTEMTGTMSAAVSDARGTVYKRVTAENEGGVYTFRFTPIGKAGVHTFMFTSPSGEGVIYKAQLTAKTTVATDDPFFSEFMQSLVDTAASTRINWTIEGKPVALNATWVRDHVHALAGSKFWDSNITDSMQFWVDAQNEKGFFYEYISNNADLSASEHAPGAVMPVGHVSPVGFDASLVRIENEADIEYLMVEGVYEAWRASGDTEWMKGTLDALDRGLVYCMSDPIRWSEEYGLMHRGVSVDTWDWVYGQLSFEGDIRRVTEDTPMAIFHGDNTGLYQACNQLAEMYAVVGNEKKSAEWSAKAVTLRENLMDAAWNGNYFSHMVHTRPTAEDAPREWQEDFASDTCRLSISNTYALNRGILTTDEAAKVIETYKALYDNPPAVEDEPNKKIFAEWLMVYPSYGYQPGIWYAKNDYANGSVVPFGAGELMRGAFNFGYETYGADVLRRLVELYRRDGELCFMYNQNGEIYNPAQRPNGGGTAAWGTGAIFDAVITGLVGAQDKGDQFETMELSPRFTSAGTRSATTVISYGGTDKYVALSYNEGEDSATYELTGDTKNVKFSALCPYNKRPVSVKINGQETRFLEKQIRESVYAEVELTRDAVYGVDVIEIVYEDIFDTDVAKALSGGAVAMKVGSPNAYRFGDAKIDETNDAVVPLIISDRTMVPARFIAESFYADVAWSEEEQKVTIKKAMDVVELYIGKNEMTVNGKAVAIDAPPQIIEGRTLVPLRMAAETLSKSVFWDESGLIVIGDEGVLDTSAETVAKIAQILK